MSRIINTWRDPYGEGFTPCRPKQITLQPGLTILVGCNGAGKTTMLMNIKDELKTHNIPCHMYDNLQDGRSHGISEAVFNNDFALASLSMSASEGENININISTLLKKFNEFMTTGRFTNRQTRLNDIFHEHKLPETKERWLLFDAVDSGYSIDNVVDLKFVFKKLINDAAEKGYELNIVISANEYELASDEQCLDVNTGKYLTFKDYDDYRKFILNSRKKKEKREERLLAKQNS